MEIIKYPLKWIVKNYFGILKLLAIVLIILFLVKSYSKEIPTKTISKTITAVTTTPYGYGEDKVQKISWSDLSGGDSGFAVKAANWTKKSVSVIGTWTGVSATIKGSNDGVTYFDLTDQQGNAIVFIANELKTIGPNTLYIKPVVTGGKSGKLQFDLIMAK